MSDLHSGKHLPAVGLQRMRQRWVGEGTAFSDHWRRLIPASFSEVTPSGSFAVGPSGCGLPRDMVICGFVRGIRMYRCSSSLLLLAMTFGLSATAAFRFPRTCPRPWRSQRISIEVEAVVLAVVGLAFEVGRRGLGCGEREDLQLIVLGQVLLRPVGGHVAGRLGLDNDVGMSGGRLLFIGTRPRRGGFGGARWTEKQAVPGRQPRRIGSSCGSCFCAPLRCVYIPAAEVELMCELRTTNLSGRQAAGWSTTVNASWCLVGSRYWHPLMHMQCRNESLSTPGATERSSTAEFGQRR